MDVKSYLEHRRHANHFLNNEEKKGPLQDGTHNSEALPRLGV